MFLEHGRPKGFELDILKSIKDSIKSEDVLIHLGDVSFYNHAFWHDELRKACKGAMWLTLGNHDKNTLTFYLKRGWDFVGHSFYLDLFGLDLEFSHRPLDNPLGINVHGHLHSGEHRGVAPTEKHRLVSIEENLSPVPLRRLLKV